MLRRTQTADPGLNGKPYLVVIIRFSSSRSFPVTVFAGSTIRELKNEIAEKQNVPASDLRLILAGQSLKDDFKLSKFYFRCGHHESSSVDETAIPLNHIKPNSRLVECITCAEKSTLVLVFPCSSGHAMCLDCFQNYGVTRLNNRTFVNVENVGYSLPCPAGCENSFVQEIHHFHLFGDDQYERYHRFSAEQVLLSEGGVLCPRPGCGNGLMLNTEKRRIHCQPPVGCGYLFCKQCLEEFHEGECGMVPVQPPLTDDIAVDEELAERSRWEAETRDVIQRTTKPCPKCKTKTEHSGGCMHMTCPQCKFQWCWICAKDWNLDCQGSHWFG
ncbi:LOW QUALITY PROTEIN: E3 ubiquitin-protein ligase parkin-like [Liolophura sinensis]|uniref:LOW QUALITY PROTEIN: E3 ubiquitin-protein ligase parkin-like n=1 Tax=Liolophura sinensis TaxID=3198878 RepID=UPI00315842BC